MDFPNYYRFIAIFSYYEDGISITFPDLPGCVSHGETEQEAMSAAKDVLLLHLWGMEQDNENIPIPSSLRSLTLDRNEVPTMIEVFMPSFREKMKTKYVKKTLSIPSWLNAEAEHCGINFSAVLKEALEQKLSKHYN